MSGLGHRHFCTPFAMAVEARLDDLRYLLDHVNWWREVEHSGPPEMEDDDAHSST